VFGKAKQTSRSISINDQKVSTTISEKMDHLAPAAKIADMATGWLAGQAARDFTATDEKMLRHFDIEQSEEFKTTKYFCKTHFDMKKIKDEELDEQRKREHVQSFRFRNVVAFPNPA